MEHMKYFLLLVTCLNVSVVFGHGGNHVEEGVWHKKTLIVEWNSNWSTEHCIDVLKPLTLKYKWSSDHAMKYDLHAHPINEKNEYQTEYFSKSDSISEESGEIITKNPGTYCFDFSPVEPLQANGKIELDYRID
jgi:hypothetical protein